MRRSIFRLIALSCAVALTGGGAAPPEVLPTDYWKDSAGFFERQAQVSLAGVSEVLARHPPATVASPERRMALVMLDQVLHDEAAPRRPSVQNFFHAQARRALGEINATRVERGAVVWKFYDHAFVVRTATITLAFDLTRAGSSGVDAFMMTPEIMRELVSQCDVLFVSHRHRDHADEEVAGLFLEQGKPVVAPPSVWLGKTIYERVTHLQRAAEVLHSLPLRHGRTQLKVIVYPGHQGRVENNVVLVTTPEGFIIAHTGDQNQRQDYGWIDQMGAGQRIDILLPNCWSPDLARMIRGARPRVVIPGHENELGHVILHREPYWLTFDRLAAADPVDAVVMAWGERFHYLPRP